MRKNPLRTVLIGTVSILGAALVLAGCSTKPASTDSTAGSIVMVHDQAAGDGSVIDSQIAGMKKIGEQLGYKVQNVYVADPANYESTLNNVVATNPTIIETSFTRITDAFDSVAAANPGIKFIHLYATPLDKPLDNLLTVSYDNNQIMYLSGVFAATFSTSGKVGWVGGSTEPSMASDYNAFLAGANSVDAGITVTPGVVGSFDDAAKGQQVANQLFSSGVDIVQAEAGGADAGVLAAVMQDPSRFLIGESPSLFDSAKGQALGSGGLDFGQSFIDSVNLVVAKGWKGGHVVTGVGSALSFTVAPSAPASSPAAERFAKATAAVESAEAALVAKSIKVPQITTMP